MKENRNSLNKSPLVSVIIPNYNHAKYLPTRIESVLSQTYKNYEVIILDDNSTDNSIDIIKRYEDNPHVSHIILNNKNSGSTFIQWEKGFNVAKGELIWIAESDDDCESILLETLTKEFIQDENCVLAFCKSIKINSDGKPFDKVGFEVSLHMSGLEFIKKHLCHHNYIANASGVVFKKSTLEKIDWTFTNYKGCGDWIAWIEIAKCGNIAYSNLPLNFFRIHNTNTTKKQAFSGKNEIEGMEVYRFMRKKGYIGYKEMLRARISHIYSVKYGKQHTFYSEETREEIMECWETNVFINLFIKIIHLIQSHTKIQIIKR